MPKAAQRNDPSDDMISFISEILGSNANDVFRFIRQAAKIYVYQAALDQPLHLQVVELFHENDTDEKLRVDRVISRPHIRTCIATNPTSFEVWSEHKGFRFSSEDRYKMVREQPPVCCKDDHSKIWEPTMSQETWVGEWLE
jgi:hypothetical protein